MKNQPYYTLTVGLGEEGLELDAEEECLEDEGDNDGHDDHGEDVEQHEEDAAVVVAAGDRVPLHDDVPVVDHRQLEQRDGRLPHALEVVEPEVQVAHRGGVWVEGVIWLH